MKSCGAGTLENTPGLPPGKRSLTVAARFRATSVSEWSGATAPAFIRILARWRAGTTRACRVETHLDPPGSGRPEKRREESRRCRLRVRATVSDANLVLSA